EGLPQIVAVLERAGDRATGVTVEGVPVELVVAPRERFGTERLRATGSEPYVAELEPLPDGRDEDAVFAALGIPFCPPELREHPFRGEPPPLVTLGEIRGDLHCHTTWSDGRESAYEMGLAARELGYEYLAICDHTPAVGAVPGLGPDDVRRQAAERRRHRGGDRDREALREGDRDQRPAGPHRPARRTRPARRRSGRAGRLLDRRPFAPGPRQHAQRRRDRASRLGHGSRRAQL